MVRIWSARTSQLTLQLTLLNLNSDCSETSQPPEQYEKTIQELRSVRYDEYDAWRYVAEFGHLVYGTSLFDTFLNDTTRFMFSLLPSSIGKSQGITVNDIVHATSTTELLHRAVDKRAREISYQSFADRISFLTSNYGLVIDIPEQTKKSLEHYSGVRNVVIHDQGHFDFALQPDGTLDIVQKACALHPKPIASGDIVKAVRAYTEVARLIASAVFRDTLKEPAPKLLKAFEVRAELDEGKQLTLENLEKEK